MTTQARCARGTETVGFAPAPIPSEYLVGARYVFSHTGELDGAKIANLIQPATLDTSSCTPTRR